MSVGRHQAFEFSNQFSTTVQRIESDYFAGERIFVVLLLKNQTPA